jgi:hypothetical protein
VLGARRAHALDHEVEAVLLVLADAVVVDGRAQELARAGRERLETSGCTPAGSSSVQQRAPFATRTTIAERPPFSKYCSTA